MEYEVRFYYSTKSLSELLTRLTTKKDLMTSERMYEKTIQYDHPNEDMSFYSKEIDGRFRVRITKNDFESKCKVSWKRRVADTIANEVNKEEEIELSILYAEYDNLIFLLEKVLKMKNVESYERYRTIFYNEEIEISVDEYPFGIALEVENKSHNEDPQEVVKKWVNILGLDLNKAYRLSWDDKYRELCKSQNVKQYNHVSFGLTMPTIMD